MKTKNLFLSILALLFLSACQTSGSSTSGWQKVFQNDASGNTLFGDKSTLIDAVRLGYPVRIGWGSSRVEHVADADFLTIFEGTEVFAQIRTIVGQAPRIDGDSLKIRFRTQNHWTKISGTNGYSTGFMTNYFQDSIVGGNVDRYTATTWYVLYPSNASDIEARPLWREGAPNWEQWENRK
ncbi:hypothetical protein RQM59_09200 [Flavobacteriaceae bacterium S356]|uniref:Uncharacterized protein n=1 Tax=Asprobacillus argus TaxID=3076534 RepID=A0ABU3LFQ9_9FLAO|nr:hypothetical protein [Flavobacteriaceae bacterium S356]